MSREMMSIISTLCVFLCLLCTVSTGSSWTQEVMFSNENNMDWEPHIAADKDSDFVYMATTRIGGQKACVTCPANPIMYKVSSDGGQTWGSESYLCNCTGTGSDQADPVFVVRDGSVYAVFMNNWNIGFTRSDDNGKTFSPWIKVAQNSDKPWLGVSNDGNDVYVCSNFNGNYSGYSGQPRVAASHDRGTTFGAPVTTFETERYAFCSGIAVNSKGVVVVVQTLMNQNDKGSVELHYSVSDDQGQTYQDFAIVSQAYAPCPVWAQCEAPDFISAGIAVTAYEGSFFILYTAASVNKGPGVPYLIMSTDNGVIWSAPRVVTTSPDANAAFPQIAAVSSTDLRLGWMDNRAVNNDTTNLYSDNHASYNTFITRWNVTSGTGTATRVSTCPSCASYKNDVGTFDFPYGDYWGMDITARGDTVAVWGEGQSWAGTGGSWFASDNQ